MNHQIPSVEDFLAQPDPAEDDLEPFQPVDLTGYVREISASLKAIAEATLASTRPAAGIFEEQVSDGHNAGACPVEQEYDDLYEKYNDVLGVISDVEAALGKSKAAPALAAKAVIDAWRKPQLPPAENQDEVDAALAAGDVEQPEAELPSLATMDEINESIPGHTRTPYENGVAYFCRECSGEQQEWVGWPCQAGYEAFYPIGVPVEPEADQKPIQPEHNAPVEEWRAYARALGFAGPEIDKANRSVIRTTLGIAQPGTD